jgi:Fic family protein
MDLALFGSTSPGDLVKITGTDPHRGPWSHSAFVPHPLAGESPELHPATYRSVANARAALAGLDSTARRLPNPRLLRRPALQIEAQSTSALEGTYEPLADVLAADQDRPPNLNFREIFNYVSMADAAFHWIEQGRSLTAGSLEGLQATLVRGTHHEHESSGSVRDHQVVIGRRPDATPADVPVQAARYIPPPPGLELRAQLQDLLDWMSVSHESEIDPVVAAAMAHYQFEALHPFHDGNGRIGRLLIVVHLLTQGTLSEPTITVSPWFEARRNEYYDRLFAVSADGDWDSYVRFFSTGLEASAHRTHDRMIALTVIQAKLKDQVRRSRLRAESAQTLVDYAVGHPSFTVRAVEHDLGLSYARANGLVSQLVELGVLAPLREDDRFSRRFSAPEVLRLLTDSDGAAP